MTIKTQDGTENVASLGLGQLGTTLGAIGTGLGLLNGGHGIFGNGTAMNNVGANGNRFVTKEELDMSMKIAEKDSTIALLQSEKTTDAKLVDVFKEAAQRDRDIRDLIALNKAEQASVNASQMAWNATAGANMATMANQIANQAAQLASITTSVVPQNKVCDTGCNCGCNS